MRVLCVGDVHSREDSVQEITKLIESNSIELVLIAGDFTNYGQPEGFSKQLVEEVQKKCNTLAVVGNLDSAKEVALLDEKRINLHAAKKSFGGIEFVGFGGSNPTPFNTPIEFSEEEIMAALMDLVDEKSFLVIHFPPFNTNGDNIKGKHVGSTALRKIIEEKQPLALICGHIHENAGIEFIGKTKIIKLPAFKDNGYAIVELPSLETKLLQQNQ